MKKIISMIIAIAMLAMSAIALAEANPQNNLAQRAPEQAQMQSGPLPGNQNDGSQQFNGQAPNGFSSFGERPSGASELPGGGAPMMIDFDEMVKKGVISQETCDKIKAYMAEHKPAGMPEMNGQMSGPMNGGEWPGYQFGTNGRSNGPAYGDERSDGRPGMNGQPNNRSNGSAYGGERPDGRPGMNGQPNNRSNGPAYGGERPDGRPGMNESNNQSNGPAMGGGLLADLLKDSVITQAEYDALVSVK